MCYSNCPYENYLGDCTLSSRKKYPPNAHCYLPPEERLANYVRKLNEAVEEDTQEESDV